MKKVLITGGAGFIGSTLALKLIEKGYQVTVLDNLSEQIHGENPILSSPLYKNILGKVEFIEGSVVDEALLRLLVKRHEIIVHYAAETGTGQSMYQIEHYSNVNIQSTAVLMDILTNEEHTIEKIVVASSRSIYGEGKYECKEHGVVYPKTRKEVFLSKGDFNVKCPICNKNVALKGTSEDSKIHPSSIYGITKQVQEQLFLVTGQSIGLPAVALRYQNVYGPGQSLSNPYTGILSIFSNRILNGNPILIFEDGEESRDFIYIDDVVNATILAIEKEEANGHALNVGAGVATSVKEVAERLLKNYNREIKYTISGNYRIGDIRHNYADLTLTKELLGFEPVFSFETGIKNFCKWVIEQELPEDKYEKSIIEMKAKGLYK